MASLLLQGGTVVGADRIVKDDVLLRDGVIEEVDRFVEEYDEVLDVTGKLLFPGLVDCHVHFREPGFPQKGTMASEAAAARAGGIAIACDMPNTDPPTTTVAALADKERRAEGIEDCALRFFFGITEESHLKEFHALMEREGEEGNALRARCCGVKIYLDHSTGDQKLAEALLPSVFDVCARRGTVVVAHCEDPAINAEAAAQNTRSAVAAHSQIRPAHGEMAAIKRVLELAKQFGTRVHIAHVSTEGGIGLIRAAKGKGIRVTCEVTPHHLLLTTDDYEKLGTLAKMNPPLRSFKHRAALWQGILDGTVDCIASDHAPHALAEKSQGEPLVAPSGVPGVETMLPLLLSIAGGRWPHPTEPWASCPPFSYHDIVRLCCTNPARIFNLPVGELTEDARRNIVVVDPEAEWTVRGAELKTHCGWTPYEGWKLKGRVERVIGANDSKL